MTFCTMKNFKKEKKKIPFMRLSMKAFLSVECCVFVGKKSGI